MTTAVSRSSDVGDDSDDEGDSDNGEGDGDNGEGGGPASWRTFHSAWSTTWSRYLAFRTSSQHAECKTCFAARQKIHDRGISMVQRLDFARQWKSHLRDQYYDRSIYWYCRYASRHKMDVLTIIIDSMDKACPRAVPPVIPATMPEKHCTIPQW